MPAACQAKKLALVSATSLLMTVASLEAGPVIDPTIKKYAAGLEVLIPAAETPLPVKRVPCIYHPVRFKKIQAKV